MQLIKDKLIQKLIQKLQKANQYLSEKIDQEPNYQNLINELEEIIAVLPNRKPRIKIISPSLDLAKQFKQIITENDELRELYEFQIVLLDEAEDIKKIVGYCEITCFIYDSQEKFSDFDRVLINSSELPDINPLILAIDNTLEVPSSDQSLSTWLEQQECQNIDNLLLPIDCFLTVNSPDCKTKIQQFTIELSAQAFRGLEKRINNQINFKIQQYFEPEKSAIWKEIGIQRDLYCQGEYCAAFNQKIHQTVQKIHKEQQQVFRKIKQLINQSRGELTNPFLEDSLLYAVQQVIQKSEVKLIQEDQQANLSLILREEENRTSIHIYIANLCQEFIIKTIDDKWDKINNSYVRGGLQELLNKIKLQLELVRDLYCQEIIIKTGEKPTIELANIISLSALKTNSIIPFDYHYSQSSWFRLFISALVGITIYLATKIIFGTGKYFGFVILIFQIINLFTGQDVKSIKLKQQTKELKRIVDSKYQVLVRFLVEKTIQNIIMALDDESQLYQQQIDAIAESSRDKLAEVRATINEHKERINQLKQDQAAILAIFQ